MTQGHAQQYSAITGVVLAGGRGTRLSPLTDTTSKHLLPIGGKPMIVRSIEQLRDAGVTDIVVLIDERYASDYMRVLRDGHELGLQRLAYVWQPLEGKGLPSAIQQVVAHIRYDKFIVACGDVLCEAGLGAPVAAFMQQSAGARMTTIAVSDSAGYSPLTLAGDDVVAIASKDKERHVPGTIDLGFYMYHRDVFDRIPQLQPSARGETEIWDLNATYMADQLLKQTTISGWWSDTGGSLELYHEADAHYGS